MTKDIIQGVRKHRADCNCNEDRHKCSQYYRCSAQVYLKRMANFHGVGYSYSFITKSKHLVSNITLGEVGLGKIFYLFSDSAIHAVSGQWVCQLIWICKVFL